MSVPRCRAVPVLCAAARHPETPGAAPKARAAPNFSAQVPETELHLGVERVRQRSITSFTLARLSFNLSALGNIPGNFRRPNNLPVAVPKRRNRQRNIDERLVFTDTNGVEVFESFAFLDSLDDECFFVPAIHRDDERNVLAYCFAGGLTKQPFRT